MRRWFVFSFLIVFTASCAPSYPRGRVAESLVDVCRREYHLPVKAQVAKTTLGVFVTIPGLFSELMRQVGAGGADNLPPPIFLEGIYQEKRFDFRFLTHGTFARVEKDRPQRENPSRIDRRKSKALTDLDHVSTALNRIALSTDAPLEFYMLMIRDPQANLDIIFSGHLSDVKQVLYLGISRGELQRRSHVGLRHPPEDIAQETVQNFLKDLHRQTILQLLSRYAAHSARFGELLPKILQLAIDLQGRATELPGREWPVLQTERDQVLVEVPLSALQLPGAVLFTIQLRESQGFILDVERLETRTLPPRYKPLPPPEKWKEIFYLEPVDLGQFLSEQITRRVLAEFQPLNNEEESSPPQSPPKIVSAPKNKPATEEDLTRVLVETSAYVLKSYRFNDFRDLTVTDTANGTRWAVPSKDIPLYLRRNPPSLKSLP